MSANRMHPLLLLYAKMLQCLGWNSAEVMTCAQQGAAVQDAACAKHTRQHRAGPAQGRAWLPARWHRLTMNSLPAGQASA